MMNKKFNQFLAKKDQSYSIIDRFRAFRLFEKYKDKISLKPIIHIIGTNGKGSTGRFLAQLLYGLNFSVGHFTSPHIFKFNERFWLNQKELDDEGLEQAHLELEGIMKEDLELLSYFEYCTFLAAIAFKKCDFIIFEAGLGGEFDSTSLFEKRLSIFTKIGFDHMHILGHKLEMIARTKLKVMAKEALISHEQENITLKFAQKIACLKQAKLYVLDEFQDEKISKELEDYALKYKLPHFLQHNLKLAVYALNILLHSQNETLKALKTLKKLDLRARFEQLNDKLFIDVGHNEMAALNLLEIFKNEKINLVYNSFLDKDIFAILRIAKPIIDKIMIYEYPSEQRALASDEIASIASKLGIKCVKFSALEANKKHVVFGSFVLVEHFLKDYLEA